MKMEKRALIAFVASILLFLAYDAIYLSPRVEKQRAQRAEELEQQRQIAGDTVSGAGAVTGPGRTGTEREPRYNELAEETRDLPAERGGPAAADTGLPEITTAEAAEFVVVTPLYKMTLSTAGAEIVSMRLLAFETLGEPVELIPQDTDWTYARSMNVSLEGPRASRSLSGLSFAAFKNDFGDAILDGSTVTVDESREFTEIVFRASHNGTGSIERYYRFYPDRYDFYTGVRFSGSAYASVTGVSWGFGPGLHSTEENVTDDQQSFKAAVMLGDEIHRLKPGDFGKKNKEEFSGTLSWVSLQSKYFISAIIPAEPMRATVVVTGNKQDNGWLYRDP